MDSYYGAPLYSGGFTVGFYCGLYCAPVGSMAHCSLPFLRGLIVTRLLHSPDCVLYCVLHGGLYCGLYCGFVCSTRSYCGLYCVMWAALRAQVPQCPIARCVSAAPIAKCSAPRCPALSVQSVSFGKVRRAVRGYVGAKCEPHHNSPQRRILQIICWTVYCTVDSTVGSPVHSTLDSAMDF